MLGVKYSIYSVNSSLDQMHISIGPSVQKTGRQKTINIFKVLFILLKCVDFKYHRFNKGA